MRAIALLVILCAASALGQNAELQFDVASIHPSNRSSRGPLRIEIANGQAIFSNLPLHMVIAEAYGVSSAQISANGHGPMMLNLFDIQAKADAERTPRELRLMLRALLEDRFRMRSHFEQQTAKGLVMTAGRSGLKAKAATKGDPIEPPHFTANEFRGENASLEDIAVAIGKRTYTPIENKTGITERFTFSVNSAKFDINGQRDIDEVLDAISTSLGLRFSDGNVNVPVLVIDHIELPSEN